MILVVADSGYTRKDFIVVLMVKEREMERGDMRPLIQRRRETSGKEEEGLRGSGL